MGVFDEITIAIPTLNEEMNIDECLSALKDFSNIYVIDSGSTDSTLDICKKHNANVINFKWNGSFPKKRNWFLENFKINTDWILFIDADEVMTKDFLDEIHHKFEPNNYDGYWLSYTNYFLGKAMRFGFQQKKLALFRTKFRYEYIQSQSVSQYDMEIHEHPVGLNRLGRLKAPIMHNDYNGLEKFIQKHVVYAKWECERLHSMKGSSMLTLRQKLKYKFLKIPFSPFLYFILDFFILLRILDGSTGLKYSFYKAWYFSVIRDLVREYET